MQPARKADKWRNIYNQVKQLGQFIKDSTTDTKGHHKLPLISIAEKEELFHKIKQLQDIASSYLNYVKLLPRTPAWRFDIKDARTQASHSDFKYHHKMTQEAILKYGDDFMSTKESKVETLIY
jgi:hypothetical protein